MEVPTNLSQRCRNLTSSSDDVKLMVEDVQTLPAGRQLQTEGTASADRREPPVAKNSPMQDFVMIKIVARIVLQLLRRFWAFSSAAVLAIVLFYWLCGGILAFCFVIFSFSGLLYHAGDRFLYHPDQPNTARAFVPSPATLGLLFESVYIRSRDQIRLHMFFVKHAESRFSTPTVLFLHGNAGNIGHRLPNVQELVTKLGYNVCLLEYRGYGYSNGTPSEDGIYLDAQAALDHLRSRQDIDTCKIVVFGRSLGGAVAIDVSSRTENRDKICCLIVENSFTSIPAIARVLFNFRFMHAIPKWFYKNRFEAMSKCRRLSRPTLFLSGLSDKLVPPSMMTDLFNACAAEPKYLARFPDGSHNETWVCSQYLQTISYFLEEIVQVNGPTGNRPAVPTTLVSNGDSVV